MFVWFTKNKLFVIWANVLLFLCSCADLTKYEHYDDYINIKNLPFVMMALVAAGTLNFKCKNKKKTSFIVQSITNLITAKYIP